MLLYSRFGMTVLEKKIVRRQYGQGKIKATRSLRRYCPDQVKGSGYYPLSAKAAPLCLICSFVQIVAQPEI